MFKILNKKELAPNIFMFKINAPFVARKNKPGQFVIIRAYENGERFPLTIADSDPKEGSITIICQGIGKSTLYLNSIPQGSSLSDIVGPLGNSTHIKNFGTAVCIGGGVGIAEAWPIARALKQAGNNVISIIGGRTKELIIMEDEMAKISDRLYVTTDDGSYKQKGFVTDALKSIIEGGTTINFVLAIGPLPMMRAISNMTRSYSIKTMVSLNSIMLDGTGMCGACRVTVDGKRKFVCVDGPEFDGHLVDFDEIAKRQQVYKAQEKLSLEQYIHKQGPCHADSSIGNQKAAN